MKTASAIDADALASLTSAIQQPVPCPLHLQHYATIDMTLGYSNRLRALRQYIWLRLSYQSQYILNHLVKYRFLHGLVEAVFDMELMPRHHEF